MKLPNAYRAFVDMRKLRDYCLNREHPKGSHKARVFESALGLTARDAEELRDALLDAVRTMDTAELGRNDDYGQRFGLDFDMTRGVQRARVLSVWIVRRDEGFPRLVTCQVL